MQLSAVEYGTLWVWERGNGRRRPGPDRIRATFQELQPAEIDELAAAMNLPNPDPIQQRLAGNRRCFTLRADSRLITYGWVTQGPESVGELERKFHLRQDEAYVWDCATIPDRRKQGAYTTLLIHIIEQLNAEAVPRIWIGASRLNRPSVRGIANAGFTHVIDVTYRRFERLSLLYLHRAPATPPPLTAAAHRILLNSHERLIGRFAIGYIHGGSRR